MGRSRKKRRRSPERPSPEPEAGVGRVWDWLTRHYPMIVAFAAGISALSYGIGFFAHRSREGLLALREPLNYALRDAVLTSVDVVGSLLRNALLALFSGHPWLLAGAWGCIAALLLAWAADRWLPAARRPVAAGVLLTLTWVVLLFAARFYTAALFPPHAAEATGPAFNVDPGGTLVESAQFEAVSWLTNDEPGNDLRRQALGGLAGWFLLVAGWSACRAWRRPEIPRRWRRGLMIACALMVALFASLVPRAHVVAAWGLKYPRLTIKAADPKCDPELARALAQPGCCLFDVSAGGRPRKTLRWGDACPQPQGFETWGEDRVHCLVSHGERVISDDC